MFAALLENQPVIVSLDVDKSIYDKLKSLQEAGVGLVEINSTDIGILRECVESFPKLKIGGGNIVNVDQLESCHKAGVHFCTSPGLLPSLMQTAAVYSIPYLPGISTISDAMQVMALGYNSARPSANLGFCTELNKYLPKLNLIPAYLEWEDIEHFWNLPSVVAVSIQNPTTNIIHTLMRGTLVS